MEYRVTGVLYEIPVEFTYVNKKKMIKDMEITYVNQKKFTYMNSWKPTPSAQSLSPGQLVAQSRREASVEEGTGAIPVEFTYVNKKKMI